MDYPKISVQILNYNGKRFLEDCINSLLMQKYRALEIVVIDNNSSDGSLSFLKKYGKKIKVVALKENKGFAGAYSESYKKCNADYFVTLNNDVKILDENFFLNLVTFAKKGNFAVVEAIEYPWTEKKFPNRTSFDTLGLLGFHAPNVLRKNNIFAIGGPCMMIDKNQVDFLFPKEYFAYGEDVFLFLRSKLRGLKVGVCTKAKFLHYSRGTAGRRNAFIRFHTEKSRLANLLIFYERDTLFRTLPLLAFELILKQIYSITYPTIFFANIKALFWNLRNLKMILRYRKIVQDERKLNDVEIFRFFSYKIFPEHISKVSKLLNELSKRYCRLLGIKTYDLKS